MFKSLETQWERAFVDSDNSGRNMMLAAVAIIVMVIIIGVVAEAFFDVALLGVTSAKVTGTRVYYFREVANHKTIWDLLELVIVPATLLLFGFLLARRQDARQSRDVENRADNDRKIAADQFEQAALHSYLDAITELLLANGRQEGEPGDTVKELIQIRTFTVLLR